MSVPVPVVAAAAAGLAVLLIAWLVLRHRRPGYLVTVQKTVNVTHQPEVVTIQRNLPARASDRDLFRAIDRMGTAAVARMQVINDDIRETTDQIGDELAGRRERMKDLREYTSNKRMRKAARHLGKPVYEITREDIDKLYPRPKPEEIEA